MNISRLREDVVKFSTTILQPSAGSIQLQSAKGGLSFIEERYNAKVKNKKVSS